MGGRGSSSGVSAAGRKYGSQYNTVLRSGNVLFVEKYERNSEALMETMTKGRVYVTVGGDDLISITYFDKENKRTKTINLDHLHKGMQPHTHHGYLHAENDGPKGGTRLTTEEKKMVDRVGKIWYNRKRKGK